MRHINRLIGLAALASAAPALGGFATYNLGSIRDQNGWTTTDNFTTSVTVGNWDQAIVDVAGTKVWRMSNAVTTGGFSNQTCSYSSAAVAGEVGAGNSTTGALWNDRGSVGSSPTPSQHGAFASSTQFYCKVDFRSATGGAQSGLQLDLHAAARQSGGRQTGLRIVDSGSGFSLVAYEAGANGSNFNNTTGAIDSPVTVASGLSYSALHTLEMTIDFVAGLDSVGGAVVGNDIVRYYLNGSLIHTGSTFEAYWALNNPWNAQYAATGASRRIQAVDALMFRSTGPAAAGTAGAGFYFEDVTVANVPAPGALALLGLVGLAPSRRRR
jgi:MYXO-CTERM domain-containing protein